MSPIWPGMLQISSFLAHFRPISYEKYRKNPQFIVESSLTCSAPSCRGCFRRVPARRTQTQTAAGQSRKSSSEKQKKSQKKKAQKSPPKSPKNPPKAKKKPPKNTPKTEKNTPKNRKKKRETQCFMVEKIGDQRWILNILVWVFCFN
jgi:hypothetical protein